MKVNVMIKKILCIAVVSCSCASMQSSATKQDMLTFKNYELKVLAAKTLANLKSAHKVLDAKYKVGECKQVHKDFLKKFQTASNEKTVSESMKTIAWALTGRWFLWGKTEVIDDTPELEQLKRRYLGDLKSLGDGTPLLPDTQDSEYEKFVSTGEPVDEIEIEGGRPAFEGDIV